jgi:hypothetical protein
MTKTTETGLPAPVVVNDEEALLHVHGTPRTRWSAVGRSRTLSPFKISFADEHDNIVTH